MVHRLQEKLQDGFLRFGWLVPACLPAAMIGGRGLFHTLFFLYILWALSSIRQLRLEDHRGYLLLYGLLLASYALSIPFATDLARALKAWSTLVLFSASTLITLAMLQREPDNLRRLLAALGLFGLIGLLAAYLDLGVILLSADTFTPRLQLQATSLTFYLPFLLAWLWFRIPGRQARHLAIGLALASLTGYVTLAEERSAFVGLVCALAGMALLACRMRTHHALLLLGAVILVALALNGEALLRGLNTEGGIFAQLDAFSSGRLTLWTQALQSPPDPWLTGVGMGNARYHSEAITIHGALVKHLHNLWLDAWYETGLLGLAMLVTLLLYLFTTTVRAWKHLAGADQLGAALFLSAALSILAEAQFSISYASREFALFGFTCFAALLHLAQRAGRPLPPETPPPASSRSTTPTGTPPWTPNPRP